MIGDGIGDRIGDGIEEEIRQSWSPRVWAVQLQASLNPWIRQVVDGEVARNDLLWVLSTSRPVNSIPPGNDRCQVMTPRDRPWVLYTVCRQILVGGGRVAALLAVCWWPRAPGTPHSRNASPVSKSGSLCTSRRMPQRRVTVCGDLKPDTAALYRKYVCRFRQPTHITDGDNARDLYRHWKLPRPRLWDASTWLHGRQRPVQNASCMCLVSHGSI